MPLVVQQRRRLSPLERYAVDLVFDGAVDPGELSVEVSDRITIGGDGVASIYSGDGRIAISRIKHADAEDLDILTEVDDIDKTRPNNISYLSRIVHEAGHYWQEKHKRHNTRRPYYHFSDKVLQRTNFICKEQHASVGQVYFILKWQWDLGIPQLNLTTDAYRPENVGPADRYCRIAVRRSIYSKRYMSRREVSKFFPSRFDPYLVDLN